MGITDSDPLVKGDEVIRELVGDWDRYLNQEDKKEEIGVIRREVCVNRPVGDESFIKKLEKRFKCSIKRQKVGRPKKPTNN